MNDDSNDGAKRKRRRRALIAFAAVLAPVVATANWRIAAKAGYPPALSLLAFVSPLNIFVFLAFVCREWPVQRELRLLREAAGTDRASSAPQEHAR